MSNISISVIDKTTHKVIESNGGDNILLPTKPAVIKLGLSVDEITKITKEGNDAVIVLKNGETIILKDFFSIDNSLILESSEHELLWVKFVDDSGTFLAKATYQTLADIEPLLYEGSAVAIEPWMYGAAGVAIAGLAAAAASGSSSKSNENISNSDIAKTTVKAAQEAYAAADKILADALKDGLITPTEQALITKALADAIAAKGAAQTAVDLLPASETKASFQGTLTGLIDIEVPAVTDADGNGIADSADVAAATVSVAAAEDAYQAAKDALIVANTNGLITPAEKVALELAKADAEQAKVDAQTKVDALPASE